MYHFEVFLICYKCIISLVEDYTTLREYFRLEISRADRLNYLFSENLTSLGYSEWNFGKRSPIRESKNAIK